MGKIRIVFSRHEYIAAEGDLCSPDCMHLLAWREMDGQKRGKCELFRDKKTLEITPLEKDGNRYKRCKACLLAEKTKMYFMGDRFGKLVEDENDE